MGLYVDQKKHVHDILTNYANDIIYNWRYGATLTGIAKCYGVSTWTIKNFLIKKNLFPRVKHDLDFDTSPFRDRTAMILESEHNNILNLYRCGESIESISMRIGISVYLLRKFLIKVGVYCRSGHLLKDAMPKNTNQVSDHSTVSRWKEYNFACQVRDMLNDGHGFQFIAHELNSTVDEVCKSVRLHLKTRGSRWCI